MTIERTVTSLARLVALRGREVDRLSLDLAGKRAQCERQRHTLARMENLKDSMEPGIVADARGYNPALALNRADYQVVLQDLIEMQRATLVRHETDVAESHDAFSHAAIKHKSLDTVLQRKQQMLQQAHAVREQKRQDQMATQAWLRQAHP
ncbi:flagellar export protein FliJ [Paraburkholderia hayleyella]|uniref:flagellar export protein FliJ n=1 Tax=Paraburkholderia hayleyella TaxID=2152889 RepID=UPI001580E721|nr:flagellar export protein FliJ [Paraburkholderia hayleyella]